jgi:hypothetical protein
MLEKPLSVACFGVERQIFFTVPYRSLVPGLFRPQTHNLPLDHLLPDGVRSKLTKYRQATYLKLLSEPGRRRRRRAH